MKYLVFLDFMDRLTLDVAKDKAEEGNDIYLIKCDKSFGICRANYQGNSSICNLCSKCMRSLVKKTIIGENVHYVSLTELYSKYNILPKTHSFSYNNVKELKGIKYRGIDIGYAAFSTFASVTRNIMPSFNDYFKKYINTLFDSQIQMIDALNLYVDEIVPDWIIFHNGRHVTNKCFYQLAKNRNIPFVATERMWDSDHVTLSNNFVNDIPHSSAAIVNKIEEMWNSGDANKNIEIAHEFFYNRRYGKYAGDVVYTSHQKQGLLPDNYNTDKKNIVIFNSSEDEYYSLSEEYDNSGLFDNQYEALKTIFDHYSGSKEYAFYLRIHPNLSNVPWKSHRLLYTLKYSNVTIIPPESQISSYSLMDIADKIIVFNSTMGIEGTYWGKVVMALSYSYYNNLNAVYTPKTVRDLYDFIENDELKPKTKDGCLKSAVYLMGCKLKPLKYYYQKEDIYKLFGKEIWVGNDFTFLRSHLLFSLLILFYRVLSEFGIQGTFRKIGENTK